MNAGNGVGFESEAPIPGLFGRISRRHFPTFRRLFLLLFPRADAEPQQPRYQDGFEIMVEKPPDGLVRRFFVTNRHLIGLLFGGNFAYVTAVLCPGGQPPPGFFILRAVAWLSRPFIDQNLIFKPFPVQLRRRLEILGPTYIKLGQVLSLREDILPKSITDELKNLLNKLPIVTFDRFEVLLAEALKRPIDDMFIHIDPVPLGSASIAQTHRAVTVNGEMVILKMVKPGIKQTLSRDAILINMLGTVLQWFIPQFQPKKVLNEFAEYTLREVDLRLEGDNAESFAANFRDLEDVCFPRIYRRYSCESVLCMEYFDGMRPDSLEALSLRKSEKQHLLDMGAAAIIRMLYRDGFFHADLHPGNLLILHGNRAGFIDLGMVGRFDDKLRRTLLYYYYCLVTGDAENAARYLTMVAEPGRKGNPEAFRRAVEDVSRRWSRTANFNDFSLAQLILHSVSLGGKYRMYFPMEMVLMVKALVTFEGVGQQLVPGFDVAALSKKHITKLFMAQFNPVTIAREGLRGAPEIVDAVIQAPRLITMAIRALENGSKGRQASNLSGTRATIFAGFCMLSGAVILAGQSDRLLSLPFFVLAVVLIFRHGE